MGTGVPIFMGSPFLRDTGIIIAVIAAVLGETQRHHSVEIGKKALGC